MDIQKIISDVVARLTGNKDLIAKFTSKPLETIKELLGIDLDPKQLDEVVFPQQNPGNFQKTLNCVYITKGAA